MEKLRKIRKDNNLCMNCGCTKDRKGCYCTICFNKYKILKRNWAIKYYNDGKCVHCGSTRDKGGWICKSCTNKIRVYAKSKADQRRELGLCVRCGVSSLPYRYCQKCRDARMEMYHNKK